MAKKKKAAAVANETGTGSNLGKFLLILLPRGSFPLFIQSNFKLRPPFAFISKPAKSYFQTGAVPHADIYLSSAIRNVWVTHYNG